MRRNELIERFELDPTKKARTYSKGNRQKVALIAAFCSDAELFILDEPTSGLDPLMETVFQECVAEVSTRGCAVLLSSHILAEVEKLCHRVTIVRAGRTVLSGSLAELRHFMRTSVTVRTLANPSGLKSIPQLRDVTIGGNRASFTVDRSDLDRTMEQLAGLGIVDLSVAPASLEELFMREYQGASR